MKVTIIKEDSVVGIDRVFRKVDCSDLPNNFHAFQWYDDQNYGEEEWNGNPKPTNTIVESLQKYQIYIDRWNAANTA